MQRKLGTDRAKALRLRLDELRAAAEMPDLLLMGGKWEAMTADRAGDWSGHLTGNWRVMVRPDSLSQVVVLVLEVVDYHRRS